MNGRDREAGAGPLIAVGAVFLGVAWFFWPRSPEADGVQWFFAGVMGLLGAATAIRGARKASAEMQTRRKRAASLIPSGAFGRAAFATLRQCRDAGLTDPGGLFLGALDGTPLFYTGKAHLLTVAPARQGKGVSVVVPNLLHWQGSVFVTDPKGELAGVTARHRRERFGQQVYVINPWGLHGLPRHRFNPLQGLLEAAGDAVAWRGVMDDANAIALQLVPEPEDQRNRYFRDGARKILRALLLHFATRGRPDACNLVEVWRTLQNMRRLKGVVGEMAGNGSLNGAVLDMADDLSHTLTDNPDQFGDFREGAVQGVSIFDPVGWLGESVSGSDFSLSVLKSGRASVYLVIPSDRIETHGAWLGLVTRQAISSISRIRSQEPVLFLLDEFANMGRLAGLAESLTALPGLGVRVWAIVQELADLRRVYGPETTETVLSQAEVKQFFAVQNHSLARELSGALGSRTIKTMSYNLGRTEIDEVGESVGETGRPLLSPDEIRQLPQGKQLLLIRSLPPVLADRVAFWDVSPWQEWADPNPVEGTHPRGRSSYALHYRQRG